MSGISVNTETGQGTSITGLASGIETSAIIKALVEAERIPIKHLTTQQEKVQAQQAQLRSLQGALQQLSFEVSEFSLPSLYQSSQRVTSSEPQRVGASTSAGAGVGGYQVEVKQLANSAQRTFSYAVPAGEEALTIDGHEYKLKEGETAKELASAINSDGTATVYAAVLGTETIVLSDRATGASGEEFIAVSGGALTEKAGTAKAGKDAEYAVDGVEGSSKSNILTEAIPGVTLTLSGVTTTSGPVTINVQPPGPNTEALEAQIQTFVKVYNATVEAIQKQVTTKPPEGASGAGEFAVGALFGDTDLISLLTTMRTTMYESVAGLPGTMSNPGDIGLGAGAPGGSSSQASIEGLIKLEPSKLRSALSESPEAVQQMLQGWAQNLGKAISAGSGPGGTLGIRIEGDETQVTQLKSRITSMNEMVAVREKAIVQEYAAMEAALARNSTQLSWLTQQTESLPKG